MKNYVLFTFAVAVVSIGVFFLTFEKGKKRLPKIMMVVTLCAISSIGRVIFGFIPQVQPTTVIVLLAGVTLGPQSGFLTGALSALVSNMAMGQGPWTPWQMLAWGLIGVIGGLLGKTSLKNNFPVVCSVAFVCGFLFSIIMDIYTISSIGQAVNGKMALATIGAGFLFNISHAVGNLVFVLLIYKPMCKKIERVRKKYG